MKRTRYILSRIGTDLVSLVSRFLNAFLFGGSTAAQVSDTNLVNLFARNPDVIIWLPGGSDNGARGTVGSFYGGVDGELTVPEISIGGAYSGTYFIQAVDYGIRRILAQYYNIRARAGLTGSETEAQKNTAIRAVSKPMLIVCADAGLV